MHPPHWLIRGDNALKSRNSMCDVDCTAKEQHKPLHADAHQWFINFVILFLGKPIESWRRTASWKLPKWRAAARTRSSSYGTCKNAASSWYRRMMNTKCSFWLTWRKLDLAACLIISPCLLILAITRSVEMWKKPMPFVIVSCLRSNKSPQHSYWVWLEKDNR